jgi:hypothetical protein
MFCLVGIDTIILLHCYYFDKNIQVKVINTNAFCNELWNLTALLRNRQSELGGTKKDKVAQRNDR